MSNKKKTEADAKETETVVTATKTLSSGEDGIKTPIIHETVQEIPKRENVMYVGPTVHGIGIQNRVYSEIPEEAKGAIAENPMIGNLFISIRDYPKANKMLREKQGYIYSAYMEALELKK